MVNVVYEWCFETIDEHGDIIELDFENNISDFNSDRVTDTFCLVRYVGDKFNGLQDRLWAYVKDGKLPEVFSDENENQTSYIVPKRFHKEFATDYLKLINSEEK